VDDRLHYVDLPVAEERRERQANGRLARYVAVLFGNFTARAQTSPTCDHDSRDQSRHKNHSTRNSVIALAYVPEFANTPVERREGRAAASFEMVTCPGLHGVGEIG
jgi:hypothetical protein